MKEVANISKEDVLRYADVARLAISDAEAEKYSRDLSAVLTFAEKIQEINTDDVKPTTNGNDAKGVLRDDTPEVWGEREKIFDNAPDHEDGQFKVPAILD